MNNFQKKWYQRPVWIIVLLIFFFPVGLFLMWKYSNWNKTVKGIVSGCIALAFFLSIASPKVRLEEIELSIPDYQSEYDINTDIPLTTILHPENSTATLTYHSTGTTINFSDTSFNTGSAEGTYEIYATAEGKKSNTLSITIVDKATKEAEEKRIAAEKAAKEAEERRIAAEKAAKEAEEKRIAEEKAAKEAEEQRIATEQNAKESETGQPTEENNANEVEENNANTTTDTDSSPDAGDSGSLNDNPDQQQTAATYVLNIGTKRIHHPSCRDVKKIAPQNYATSNLTLDELLGQGYTTCGHCF